MQYSSIVKQHLFLAILLLNSLFSLSQPAGVTKPVYRKIGPVYVVDLSDNRQQVLSVLEWKEVSGKTIYHYFIQLNDLQTAAIVNQKEIAVIKDKPMDPEQFIGRMGKLFWVLTDSLTGYNETTLEVAATESDIAGKNPFMKNSFSRRHNSYLLDEFAQVMYVGAEDGERYKLYPEGLLMKPDNTSSDLGPDGFSYEFAAEYKINDRYNLQFAISGIDTLSGSMYLLGSEKEISNMLTFEGSTIYPVQDESRQLTIVPYHVTGEKIDYQKDKRVTGKINYFKAGFIQRKFSTVVWRSKREERIIVFHSNKTNKAALCFAMIDAKGNEKWTFSSGYGISDFTDYLLFENQLLVWFNTSQKETGKQQSTFISIGMMDGKSSSYTYGQ